jgi:hypothetical protein
MKHIQSFENFLNESIETTDDFSKSKKNRSEYTELITKAVAKEFNFSTSLFSQDFIFQIADDMGETKAIITLPMSEGDKKKEKLAGEIEDFINDYVKKESKIKDLQYSPTKTGKVANVGTANNGNWIVMWRPVFFRR